MFYFEYYVAKTKAGISPDSYRGVVCAEDEEDAKTKVMKSTNANGIENGDYLLTVYNGYNEHTISPDGTFKLK